MPAFEQLTTRISRDTLSQDVLESQGVPPIPAETMLLGTNRAGQRTGWWTQIGNVVSCSWDRQHRFRKAHFTSTCNECDLERSISGRAQSTHGVWCPVDALKMLAVGMPATFALVLAVLALVSIAPSRGLLGYCDGFVVILRGVYAIVKAAPMFFPGSTRRKTYRGPSNR